MADVASAATGLLQIIVADLVLSGDNAVVIGLAVSRLPDHLRKRAVLLGTMGAIGLRVLFTIFATLLLRVPLLSALGGLTLFWIGYSLLANQSDEPDPVGRQAENFAQAIRTIIIADAVMSLDNALAVAGAARGNITLLLVGLALSIPLLMVGANLVSSLFSRLPWLTLLGAALIAWVGADLIHKDKLIGSWLPFLDQAWTLYALGAIAVIGVVALGLRSQKRARRADALDAPERDVSRSRERGTSR
jgi:YjbE family integral membrane protein